jgi:hypothetical protein
VSPVKYELGFYIPEDGILHSHSRGNLNSYVGIGFDYWRMLVRQGGPSSSPSVRSVETETKNSVALSPQANYTD